MKQFSFILIGSKCNKNFLVLFCVLCIVGNSDTRGQSVQTILSAQHITIGNPFEVTYIVKDAKKDELRFPVLHWKGVSLLKQWTKDSTTEKGKALVICTYQLLGIEPGHFLLPEQVVFLNKKLLKTSSVSVYIDLLPVSEPDLKIEPLPTISYTKQEWMPYVAVFSISILLGMLWFLKHWFTKRQCNFSTPKKNSLKKLNALSQNRISLTDKRYYSQISQILKEFLSQQFGVMANSMTLNEIVRELQLRGVESATINQLEKIVEQLHFVMYAPEANTKSNSESLHSEVQDLIRTITTH